MGFFIFFAMGHLIGLSSKTLWNPPFTKFFFTLFYTYIILHSHIKPYKYIDFYKFCVLYIHKCKWILNIYKHNTGSFSLQWILSIWFKILKNNNNKWN
jgi:hypothetical protein